MEANRVNEMLSVAEAAAFAAGAWTGKGQKDRADAAAVEAMRDRFNEMSFSGRIVIGEGERDEAPMLYIGEEVGGAREDGEEIDIAVDPLEGTNLCAFAQPNALAVLAYAPRGALLYAPDTYMEKIAAGPAARDAIDIDATPAENVTRVAAALGKNAEDLVVCVLERERHEEMIAAIRAAGARVRLITDGDVFGSVATAIEGTGIDLYMGSGGAPEGVLAATAMKCVGGGFMGRFRFRNDEERARAEKTSGVDIDGVLAMDDLVRSDEAVFIATGVTDGEMVRGVRGVYGNGRAHSVIMDCRTKTVRFVETIYRGDGEGTFALS
ncbi:MAG: class II fructose-bisphosphatase [Coriobacteriia bacterium]|nr:class II fructose-bisphosphatase [Coriobacteriia bacterium]